MKTISFFFCFANDSIEYVDEAEQYLHSLNNDWDDLYYIKYKDWRSFGAQSKDSGVQQIYNNSITKSDYAVIIINQSVGNQTKIEFDMIMERLKHRCRKPKILLYLKKGDFVKDNIKKLNVDSKHITYLLFETAQKINADIGSKISDIIKQDIVSLHRKRHDGNRTAENRLHKLAEKFPTLYEEVLIQEQSKLQIQPAKAYSIDALSAKPIRTVRTNKQTISNKNKME